MDNNNNDYYKYETQHYETPECVEPSNNEKYKSITNISQLSNYYIKQPKSNIFIIRCQNDFQALLLISLIGCASFIGLILLLIYDKSGENSTVGIIIGIIFSGFISGIVLCATLTFIIKQKVILTEDYIQIISYYILCCLNKNEIHNYMNINNFQVDIQTSRDSEGEEIKTNHIVCLDIFNKKKYFFKNNFSLEEAEYFVYIVNDFINKKKNMITIS